MRATFIPDSASGFAQPKITSSISDFCTAGFFSSNFWNTAAARSSGRVFFSVPRGALPTAVRMQSTITASFISILRCSQTRSLTFAPQLTAFNAFLTGRLQLVPQRLAGLQHILHAFLRFWIPAQAQERFALQIQQILLAHGLFAGEQAARSTPSRSFRRPPRRDRKCSRPAAWSTRPVSAARSAIRSADLHIRARRTGQIFANQRQRERLGVADQALPRSSKSDRTRAGIRASEHLRRSTKPSPYRSLERAARIVPAQQHFLAAAAGRNQSDADLHQSHVSFRRSLHAMRVQRNFAAAAQRPCERRGDHRLRRVLDRHIHVLEARDGARSVRPIRLPARPASPASGSRRR